MLPVVAHCDRTLCENRHPFWMTVFLYFKWLWETSKLLALAPLTTLGWLDEDVRELHYPRTQEA